MVAVLAHALGVIRRDIFHQPCDVNALATAARCITASEILTGDLPTPIKYHNAGDHSAPRSGRAKLLSAGAPSCSPRIRTATFTR